jgi:hypothetical protein
MKKIVARVAIGALIAVAGLTACGDDEPDQFVPASFGADGQCYWVESEDEVRVLKDDDLCERNAQPVHAGSDHDSSDWLLFYALYLNSPAYYNRYVPVAQRTVYVEHRTVYNRTHASEIKAAAPRAKYKGSNGKIYTGDKVKTSKFGNGGSRGFGKGTRNCSMGALNASGLVMKGGGGTGGSRGGGTRTTTRTGGGTKPKPGTNTRPKGGCR